MSDAIEQALESAATNPARVRTDAGEVQAQDIGKIIEAARYLAGKSAVTASTTNTRRGLRFNQIVPGGFDAS